MMVMMISRISGESHNMEERNEIVRAEQRSRKQHNKQKMRKSAPSLSIASIRTAIETYNMLVRGGAHNDLECCRLHEGENSCCKKTFFGI